MLPIKHKKNILKKSMPVIAAALLIAVGAIGYMAYSGTAIFSDQSPTQETTNAPNQPLSEEALGVEPAKQSDPTSNSAKSNTDSPDQTIPDGELIEITVAQRNEDAYAVRTLIKKITNEGTCRLVMKSRQKSYTETAGVQATASSSTCKGFNIPLDQLGKGTWTIQVTYSKGSITSKATKEVIIDA
jgi:hypothetical protein